MPNPKSKIVHLKNSPHSIEGQFLCFQVPKAYFPDGFDQWNAYSISGTGESRAYKSLFPVPGEAPDFHRIGDFQSLEGFNCLKTSSKGDLFAKSLVWVKEE